MMTQEQVDAEDAIMRERQAWINSGTTMDHVLAVKLLRAMIADMKQWNHYENCDPMPEIEAIECILGEVTS